MKDNYKVSDLEMAEKGEARKSNPAFQTELIIALKKNNLERFKQLLPYIDINYFYSHPHDGTCLYIAAAKGLQEFAELCIEEKADVNHYNSSRKDTPLHAACKEGHPKMVELLLKHGADISAKNKFGRQPLHTVVFIDKDKYKKEHLQCLTTLLDFKADINAVDRSSSTALHLALIKNNRSAAEALLSKDANPYIKPYSEEVIELIKEQLPDLYDNLHPQEYYKPDEDNVENLLFTHMYNKNLHEFKQDLKVAIAKKINIGNIQDGKNTLLQHACEREGLEGFIKVLLESNEVDPNGTFFGNDSEPVLLAAFQGNHNGLRVLVNQPETKITVKDRCKQTALHKVARMEKGSNEEMSYLKSLQILIEAMRDKRKDYLINAVDSLGNTALHYAARNLDRGSREAEELVSALLRANAYVGIQNNMSEPAISRVRPSLIENYLDECLGTNGEPPCEEQYELTFNYSILTPPCLDPNKYSEDAEHAEEVEQAEESARFFKETEPLTYICRNKDYQNLMKHPIVTSFLYLKWHRIRWIFYLNLIFYIFFVGFITAYILGMYGTDPRDEKTGNSSSVKGTDAVLGNDGTDPLDRKTDNSSSMQWTDAVLGVSTILLSVLALRELFQLMMSPWQYIKSLENLLEVTVIVLTIMMLFSSFDNKTKQHFAAIVILLVWIELVLLIGKHPKLSTYITMFTSVSSNFCKFLLWYACFIIAFALSFFVLFRGAEDPEEENHFDNAGTAMLKTAVMLTGEFDFSELPLGTFNITSHLVFLLFLFLIAVVLLNLLNGLAVSDTQEVKNKAEMVGYISRVILVSHVESMLLGRRLQFLNKLTRCFRKSNDYKSELPSDDKSRGGLCPSIMIFPELSSIKVLVNAGGKIEPRCCSTTNTCKGSCAMDLKVIDAARSIIAKRTQCTELDKINQRLQGIEECLKQMQTVLTNINLKRSS